MQRDVSTATILPLDLRINRGWGCHLETFLCTVLSFCHLGILPRTPFSVSHLHHALAKEGVGVHPKFTFIKVSLLWHFSSTPVSCHGYESSSPLRASPSLLRDMTRSKQFTGNRPTRKNCCCDRRDGFGGIERTYSLQQSRC